MNSKKTAAAQPECTCKLAGKDCGCERCKQIRGMCDIHAETTTYSADTNNSYCTICTCNGTGGEMNCPVHQWKGEGGAQIAIEPWNKLIYKLCLECQNCGWKGTVNIPKGTPWNESICECCGCKRMMRNVDCYKLGK